MAKATLVSIVPFPIAEFKPGIYPGFFQLPASKDTIPECLVIGEAKFHVEIDEARTITVSVHPDNMAKSIVEDYVTSNLAYSAIKDAAPGFFWESGEWSSSDILTRFREKYEENVARQRRWFQELIKLADDDWEKTRQHKFISDMQRYAAKSLKLERPWIIVPGDIIENTFKCLACQSIISAEAVICPHCKMIINLEKYKTMQFAER